MDLMDLYVKLKMDTSEYEQGAKDVESQSSSIGAKAVAMGNITASAIKTVVKGVVDVGKDVFNVGASFDTAMSQVAATMGTSVDSIQDLSSAAREMGATTQFTATEAAEALNYLALAGYDSATSIETLPTVLNLAAAGAMDLGSASDMVTDAMSALGLDTSYSITMVDQMAKTASTTNTSVSQLGNAILTVGATARGLKGGTTELNTALGILANNGIKGAEGGTKLRNVIMSLQSPTDQAADMIKGLGLEVYDSQGKMRGLDEILGDLNTSISDLNDAEKDQIINTLFNKADIAAVNALLANTGEEWENIASAIEDSGGAAEQMANTQLDNVEGSLTLMNSALDGLKLSLYDTFSETANSAIKGFTDIITNAGTWVSEHGETITGFITGVGSVLQTAWDVASTIFEAIKNGITQVMASANGGGITWSTVWSGISSALMTAGAYVVSVINLISTAFSTLVSEATTEGTLLNMIWTTIQTVFETVGSVISTWVETLTALFSGDLSTALTGVGEIFSTVVSGIGSAFSGLTEIVGTVFSSILEGAGTWVSGLGEKITSGISGVIETIGGFIGGIVDFFTGSSDDSATAATESYTTAASTISESTSTASTEVDTNMSNISTTMNTETAAQQETVSTAYETMTEDVTTAMTDQSTAVTEGYTQIGETFTTSLETINTTTETGLSTLQTKWSSAMSAVVTSVTTAMASVASLLNQSYTVGVSVVNSATGSTEHFAKAMGHAYILNGATTFGTMGDKRLVGGEAGQEMVVGTGTLMGAIAQASGGQQVAATVAAYAEQIIGVLGQYLPNMGKQQIVLDSGELVGAISDKVDNSLGSSMAIKERGALTW